MAFPMTRRAVLRTAAVAVAAPALGITLDEPAMATAPPPASWGVQPFELGEVQLRNGVFAAKRALMLDHARGYDVDRLLQVFRANAGLPTLGAVAPGGWEGLDGEANGNLRGHYTGHFLTMLAQAYASTGEAVFGDRVRYMVGALAEARDALQRDAVALVVPGRFGTAIEQVRGSYQYVELPPTVLGGAAEITIAVWIRPSHADTWARVFDFGDDTSKYLYLAVRNASGVPRFAITNGGAGREQAIDGTAPLPVGEWSHVAVTISGTTGTLYVNGVAVAANTAMTLNPAVLGALKNHWLGRSLYPDPVFAGAFGGFDVWSRALSTADIGGLQSEAG